jgi:hypothetical protein
MLCVRRLARILFILCSPLSLVLLLAVLVLWPLSHRWELRIMAVPRIEVADGGHWWNYYAFRAVEGRLGASCRRRHDRRGEGVRRSIEWHATARSPEPSDWSYRWSRNRARRHSIRAPTWTHTRRSEFGIEYIVLDSGMTPFFSERSHSLRVPCSYIALLLSIAPAASLVSWRKRRRDAARTLAGRCMRCGYNLTGNVSGVCPECGTPAPKGAST